MKVQKTVDTQKNPLSSKQAKTQKEEIGFEESEMADLGEVIKGCNQQWRKEFDILKLINDTEVEDLDFDYIYANIKVSHLYNSFFSCSLRLGAKTNLRPRTSLFVFILFHNISVVIKLLAKLERMDPIIGLTIGIIYKKGIDKVVTKVRQIVQIVEQAKELGMVKQMLKNSTGSVCLLTKSSTYSYESVHYSFNTISLKRPLNSSVSQDEEGRSAGNKVKE